MQLYYFVIALCTGLAGCHSSELQARQNCGANYVPCNPSGARGNTLPPIGVALSSLYTDLLASVAGITISRRDVQRLADLLQVRDTKNAVCCAQGTQCLLVHEFDVPFCYDKFTTNYFLPDGSYGQIVSGNYTSSNGSFANLLTGSYTLSNGQSGNVYASDPQAKPNTATLSIPTQFTGTGVGSAIPVTALGDVVIYTTVIPASTIAPSIVAATTITEQTTLPASTVGGVTYPLTTVPPITIQATTIPGTTIMATAIVTSTKSAAAAAAAAAASTSRTGAASSLKAANAVTSYAAVIAVLSTAMAALFGLKLIQG